ncbi:MAG TPA: LON peptidase substrate-binding domain-containing protein, partial [Solirubrobacterales bacterium]|nr:LON peptidase substrate-binding domain-containing protein [Solirubrobacterales bacterium]
MSAAGNPKVGPIELEGDVGGGAPIEVVTSEEIEDAIAQGGELPAALPILPLRDMVTYPGTLTPLAVGQVRSIKLI